jgi:hypothetical protein
MLSTGARIFSVVSNTWSHLMEQFKAGVRAPEQPSNPQQS